MIKFNFVVLLIWLLGSFLINKVYRFLILRKDALHLHFLKSASTFAWTACLVFFLMNQYEGTKELNKTLLSSSSLLVAIVGFAAQQVLADMIAGVVLSWSKPFNTGEKISIDSLNISGIVENITLRHTIIRTYENSRMLVPNAVINKSVIENSNYGDHYIGHYLQVEISYDSDLERAIGLMENIVSTDPDVIDVRTDKSTGKKVLVTVNDFSPTGISLKCTVRTSDLDTNFRACSRIRRKIKAAFDENYIGFSQNGALSISVKQKDS